MTSTDCKVILLKARYAKRKKGKQANQKRHTQSTIAGIEDLTAILVDLHFLLKRIETFITASNSEIAKVQDRLDTALDTANVLRVGPYAYPKNGRSNKRKVE